MAVGADLRLLVRFGEHLEASRLAPSTRLTRERTVLRFASWLDGQIFDTELLASGHKPEEIALTSATTETVEAWLAATPRMSSSTRTGYVGALRHFYDWAISDGAHPGPNPAGPLRRWPVKADGATAVVSLWPRWKVAMERRGLAKTTLEKRRSELWRFGWHLGDRSPLEATSSDVEAFLDGRKLSPKARYNAVSHLAAFYSWAVREGLADGDPTADVDRPKLPRAVPRPIPTGDLADAIAQADRRTAAMLAFAAFAGLRCQEIAGVAREHVLDHLDPPMLLVVAGKGGRERLVPLHGDLRAVLERLPMPRAGYLFAKPNGRPVGADHVSQLLNRHLHDLGIASTAHALRHWFGSQLYALTRDLRLVQETMGHSSPTTTAIYAAFNPGAAVAAVASLSLSRKSSLASEDFRGP